MNDPINSKRKGDAAVGRAIAHFLGAGFRVAIPLSEGQSYDLVIDDGKLARVEVKFAGTIKRGKSYYEVHLATTRCNTKGIIHKPFNREASDWLFVVTGDGGEYLIPSNDVGGTSVICIGSKYLKYKLGV